MEAGSISVCLCISLFATSVDFQFHKCYVYTVTTRKKSFWFVRQKNCSQCNSIVVILNNGEYIYEHTYRHACICMCACVSVWVCACAIACVCMRMCLGIDRQTKIDTDKFTKEYIMFFTLANTATHIMHILNNITINISRVLRNPNLLKMNIAPIMPSILFSYRICRMFIHLLI